MELNHLPIIDWELSTRIAGHKPELAEDILKFFIKDLKKEIKIIKQLYQRQHYNHLLQQVHKLHSALCYCGLPRLKTLVNTIETDLKKHMHTALPDLFQQLEKEMHVLLNYYAEQPFTTSSHVS